MRSRRFFTFCTALVLACALVQSAHAQVADPSSVDAYRERVIEARKLVQEAIDGPTPAEIDAFTLSSELNELLPATERVGDDRSVVSVDNSVFRGMVGRLASSPRAGLRDEVLEEMRAHLESLERAVGEPGSSVGEDRGALDRLLADRTTTGRSSLSKLFGDLVDRLSRALVGWWESVGASPATGRVLTVVTLAILVGLTLLLVVVLIRAFVLARRETARSPRKRAGAPSVPVVTAAEGLPADPLAFAEECAAAGDLRGAVRALFGGAARSLAAAGLVRGTRVHTNGELLAQVRAGGDTRLTGTLVSLCARFERAWYGHRDPGADGFAAAREEYLAVTARLAELERERDAA